MNVFSRLTLGGLLVATLALGTSGCVGPGYPGGPGVGVAAYGDEPYYGGYGPYYGDTILFGGGNYHRGYYGNHHFYGGNFSSRGVGGRGFSNHGIGGGHTAGFGGGHGGGFGGGHAGGGGGGGHR